MSIFYLVSHNMAAAQIVISTLNKDKSIFFALFQIQFIRYAQELEKFCYLYVILIILTLNNQNSVIFISFFILIQMYNIIITNIQNSQKNKVTKV